jgi:hypothetical protein
MNEVAVVFFEDTGTIVSRSSTALADKSNVHCDSSNELRSVENAYLLDETRPNHTFNCDELAPECLGDFRQQVCVTFLKNKKGERVAIYKYRLKKPGTGLQTDPYKLTVINGRKVIEFVSGKRTTR